MSPGLRFLGFLFCAYFLQKGGALSVLELALLPLFQETLGCSSATYQKLKTVIYSPFSLKPLIAVASDAYPLCGYRKRYYIVGAAIVGGVSLLALAFQIDKIGATVVALLAFACVFSASVTDILSEGRYSEFIRDDKTGNSTKLVSYVWVCIFAARFLSAVVSGPVADNGGTIFLIFACSVLTFQIIIPCLCGAMPEAKTHGWQEIPPNFLYLGTVVILGTLTVTLAAIGGVLWVQLCTSAVIVACVYMASRSLLGSLNPMVHRTNIYLFVLSLSQVDSSPLDYFYTSDTCGGIGLTYTTYITYCGIASSLAAAVATLLVRKYTSNWSYKTLFVLATVCKCCGGLVDVALVSGWVDKSHVPIFFVLGDCMAKNTVAMLQHIPMVILTSKLTTKGSEATMYSLLAGIQNLGALISITLGHALAGMLHVELSETVCSIDSIGAFVTLAQIGIPLSSLLFISMVPDGTMNSPLTVEE